MRSRRQRPREFIPSVEKGFRSMLPKGRLIGFPVVNVRVGLTGRCLTRRGLFGYRLPRGGAWRLA